MTRLALALVVVAAGVTAAVATHKRQVTQPTVSAPSTVEPDLPFRTTPSAAERSARRAPLPAPTVPAARSGWRRWLDVTAYCATGDPTASGAMPRIGDVAVYDRTIRFGTHLRIAGNVYTVTDWIGHGSDIDIYMGAGKTCTTAARRWGRRHLEVAEVSS